MVVDDAFERLGLPRSLLLREEQVAEAFRKAGRRVHPDAGGAEGEFTNLQAAAATLSSPARRLRLWLELEGIPIEARGEISAELMDFFNEVGGLMQAAESIIRKRDAARSALGLALLESETLAVRDNLERGILRVDDLIAVECAQFREIEAERKLTTAAKILRNLGFLERWKSSLRASYARLI